MLFTEKIISIVAPHYCLSCGSVGDVLCESCLEAELVAVPPRCHRCKAISQDWSTCQKCRPQSRLKHVWAGTDYTGLAEDLVRFLKYQRGKAAAEAMADHLAGILPVLPAESVLVHVPTANSRVRARGYDQSKLLTERLAKTLGLPHKTLLMRLGHARQVGTKRRERLRQLEQAFKAVSLLDIEGMHVILVDDVMTTGATLESAAKTLKLAGAKKIDAIVFAQA